MTSTLLKQKAAAQAVADINKIIDSIYELKRHLTSGEKALDKGMKYLFDADMPAHQVEDEIAAVMSIIGVNKHELEHMLKKVRSTKEWLEAIAQQEKD